MSDGIQQFDYAVNLMEVILWQQNNAANLQALLTAKQTWYDTYHAGFWSDWENDVFNLLTANDFGLQVWALILAFPVLLSSPSTTGEKIVGFGSYNQNLYEASFAPGNGVPSLSREEKRLLLRLRAFQLFCSPNVLDINAALKTIFADFGPVYVLDGHDMTCKYVFGFIPSSGLLRVFETVDILPRPACVQMSILIEPQGRFGFSANYDNFYQSNMGGGGAIGTIGLEDGGALGTEDGGKVGTE